MSEIKVKTGREENARVVNVNYNFAESVKDLVDKYGEEQALALANRAVTLAVQAIVRQKAAAGATDEECQQAADQFVPGVRGPVTRKSPFERASAALPNLSPEELKALIDKVRAAQKAAH